MTESEYVAYKEKLRKYEGQQRLKYEKAKIRQGYKAKAKRTVQRRQDFANLIGGAGFGGGSLLGGATRKKKRKSKKRKRIVIYS